MALDWMLSGVEVILQMTGRLNESYLYWRRDGARPELWFVKTQSSLMLARRADVWSVCDLSRQCLAAVCVET